MSEEIAMGLLCKHSYYDRHKEKILEYQKEYNQINKDKYLKYQREYYINVIKPSLPIKEKTVKPVKEKTVKPIKEKTVKPIKEKTVKPVPIPPHFWIHFN
jgi:hypothetical protein